ncbi:MAG TPA: 6-carboxytetrahydropterin synthase [Dehalococcoidia bacterium]|nr:6-carboxytetrahydropterin synthase [Dehalococcoidia bacterium]
MYQVSIKQHFDAAHYLRGYGGKCEALHGHRFEVVVSVEAEKLNEIGIAFDFVELKKRLSGVVIAQVEVWESPESRATYTP